jgi:hypothetical protein
VLCAAIRNDFACTLEEHTGEHQAWCDRDLCASWSTDGKLKVFKEDEVSDPERLTGYLDEVLAGAEAEREKVAC